MLWHFSWIYNELKFNNYNFETWPQTFSNKYFEITNRCLYAIKFYMKLKELYWENYWRRSDEQILNGGHKTTFLSMIVVILIKISHPTILDYKFTSWINGSGEVIAHNLVTSGEFFILKTVIKTWRLFGYFTYV